MEEREVITLGFGNYSSLVAAQWVNGTSRYDVHHSTLYHERHLESVLGGECLFNTDRNNDDDGNNEESEERAVVGTHSIVRVPRLLLLDAPHASYFSELAHQTIAESGNSNDSENEDAKDVCYDNNNRKITHVNTLVREAKRQWWNGKQSPLYQEEEEEDEDGSTYDDDDDDQDDDEGESYEKRPNYHVDPYHTAEYEEEEEESPQYTSRKEERNTKNNSNNNNNLKFYKKLFKTRDTVVPWWRYITTGLDVHAITTLRPLHNTNDGGSEMASLHSVGYGLAHFTPNNSHAMEMEHFTDALRHELEECDHVQGVQCFIDADSCFAGAACNVLNELAQDVGGKTPMALFALFQISPFASSSSNSDKASNIPFAERRVDETHLNRLLSTAMLSSSSSSSLSSQMVYIPFEMNTWANAFEHGFQEHHRSTNASHPTYDWLEDDRATAQYIAAVCDSALYGVRDGRTSHGDQNSPAYYMNEWAHTLHVSPSMRLSSIAGALPLYSTCRTTSHSLPYATNHYRSRNNEPMKGTEDDLWNFMERHPLLPHVHHNKNKNYTINNENDNLQYEQFVPLTHPLNFSPQTESGRVLGHTLTLRGVGSLPCIHYPREEALARYAFPLSTSTYLPLLTSSGYPVSSTFPHELLAQYTQHNHERGCFTSHENNNITSMKEKKNNSTMSCAASTINVGAHVCTTYGSANYIEQIAQNAQAVFSRRFHVHKDNYYLEHDEWKEQMEEVWQMRDDYKHGEPVDDDNL